MPYPRGYKPRAIPQDRRLAELTNAVYDELLKDTRPAESWPELLARLSVSTELPPITHAGPGCTEG